MSYQAGLAVNLFFKQWYFDSDTFTNRISQQFIFVTVRTVREKGTPGFFGSAFEIIALKEIYLKLQTET